MRTAVWVCLLALAWNGAARATPAEAPSPPLPSPANARTWPVPRGSFIQEYLVRDWSEADWRRELRYMREVGMDIVIFGCTADSGKKEAYYPIGVPGYRQAQGHDDTVGKCLAAARQTGMKVILGLNFSGTEWFRKEASDPEWLYDQMRQGNLIADDLYARYHARYPDTFWGWYWVWEVDNLNFKRRDQQDVLARALDINVRHLHALDASMPVMLCPFMNAACGPAEEYAETWKYVFAHCSLKAGDIFAPQDSCGAGGINVGIVGHWFAELKKAVDTVPGLRLWSDTETFTQADWTSTPLNRFLAQLTAIRPYVSDYVTFAYCHYYSPDVVDSGFQRTWRQYVDTGVLESTPPTAPRNVTAARALDGVHLAWDVATDNVGVCGYDIYRDGKRIRRIERGRNYERDNPPITRYVDKGARFGVHYTYAVQAYDFAGNVSPKVTVRP